MKNQILDHLGLLKKPKTSKEINKSLKAKTSKGLKRIS